jgi:hypothetical protein
MNRSKWIVTKSILGKKFRIEFCLPIIRLLELICRRATEDDDAVKVEIVDTITQWCIVYVEMGVFC